MKSYLLSIALMALVGLSGKLHAQCTVSNPTVSNITRISNGSGSCTLQFDLDFSMDNNNGNKTISIHLWPGASYPTLDYTGKAPTAAQLAASYGSIIINNNGSPVYYASYPFGSGVTILSTSGTVGRTGGTGSAPFQFHISGITIPNVPCSGLVTVKGDVWSTNSGSLNANTNPQCWTQNIFLGFGDPTLSNPVKVCASPRAVSFAITTTSVTPITVNYKIYKDDNTFINGKKVFDPSADADVTSPGTLPISISSTQPYNGTNTAFVGNGTSGENSDYWVVVDHTPAGGNKYSVANITSNACASPLPVKFSSFSATRNKQAVNVKWQTATEMNNRGFYLQRQLGNAEWKNIAFIFSAAKDGNSSDQQDYYYNDNNTFTGVSQYRLQQVDMDYKTTYSETRAVKGETMNSGILVYPNPTKDGKINVVFDEQNSVKNVTVFDVAGRTVKSFQGVTGNVLTIENLNEGYYNIRVTNLATSSTTVEKIMVMKR
jgi:hypothetical protein